MKQTALMIFFSILLSTAISSCKTYSISVNNNLVYTPPPLFKDFAIEDTHLRECVEQTIIDNHITNAFELTQLNCSHAGIRSLSGLETFSSIATLNLADNNIQSIAALTNMSQLRILILRENELTSAEPTLHLLQLQELDIAANDKLACNDIKQLQANSDKVNFKITLPEQCK